MKLFKNLLTIFIVTFCLSAAVVKGAAEYHWLINGTVPRGGGKATFPEKYAKIKVDSTKQTLKTTNTNHAVKARIQMCINSGGSGCAGEYTWVSAPTNSTKTMTNGGQPGNYKIQLTTVSWQLGTTSYYGEWQVQQ